MSRSVKRTEDVTFSIARNLSLDVYAPKHIDKAAEVFVFVHGGNWTRGHKEPYKFFGKRMARKGVVMVIVDYRLAPGYTYDQMADDVATALVWTKLKIADYGGDPAKIFVSGHSAGGHLAALVSTDDSYFTRFGVSNPIAGTILIDAFGLDMHQYLQDADDDDMFVKSYKGIFSNDPEKWKAGSPIYHLHEGMKPFLVFVGGRTYASITRGTNDFMTAIKKYEPETQLILCPRKKHVPMVTQFFRSRNKAYQEIIDFMRSPVANAHL